MKFSFDKVLNKLGFNKNKKKDGFIMQVPDNGQNQLPPPLAVPKSNAVPQPQPMYRTAPGQQQQQQQQQPQPNTGMATMSQSNQYDTFNPETETGRKKGFTIDSFIPAGAAIGVCVLLLLMGVFSPTLNNYRADITRLETDLVAMRKADTNIEAKATDAVSNANKFDGRITAIEKQNTELVSSVKALPSMNDVTKATSQYDGKIASLTTTITDMNTKIAKMETDINGLKAQIELLKTQTTTTSSTGNVPSGAVSLVTNPNIWGSPVIGFSSMSPNGTYSQSFTVDIINNSGKTINNMQLGVGLQTYDSNGNNYSLPAGSNVSISSPDLFTTWQKSGSGNQVSFISSTANQFFTISQPVGKQSYTFTVTLDAGGNQLSNTNIAYSAKLLKYTTE